MTRTRVYNLSYILLIVMLFAASCEDPNLTTPDGSTDSTAIKDSIRRADSLWRRDSIRVQDSIRIIDSLHVADSLHRLDSLAPLSRPIPPSATMVVGVDAQGSDTAFSTHTPKFGTSDLYATYAPSPDGLWVITSNTLLVIKDFSGIGEYQVDGSPSIRLVQSKLNSKTYHSTSGKIRITKFDMEKHLISGEFVAEIVSSSDDDPHGIFGAFIDIDLIDYVLSKDARIDGGFYSHYYAGFGGTKYDETVNRFLIDLEYRTTQRGCRIADADVTYHINMEIPSPRVGMFLNGEATWSETEIVSQRDPRCSGGSQTYTSKLQDTLMITSWDPQRRELSGWFNVNGRRGELKAVTWRKY